MRKGSKRLAPGRESSPVSPTRAGGRGRRRRRGAAPRIAWETAPFPFPPVPRPSVPDVPHACATEPPSVASRARRSGRRRCVPGLASREGEAHERHLPRARRRQLRPHEGRPLLRRRGGGGSRRPARGEAVAHHSARSATAGGVRAATRAGIAAVMIATTNASPATASDREHRRDRCDRARRAVRRTPANPSGRRGCRGDADHDRDHGDDGRLPRDRGRHLPAPEPEHLQAPRARAAPPARDENNACASVAIAMTASSAAMTDGSPPTRPRSTRSDGLSGRYTLPIFVCESSASSLSPAGAGSGAHEDDVGDRVVPDERGGARRRSSSAPSPSRAAPANSGSTPRPTTRSRADRFRPTHVDRVAHVTAEDRRSVRVPTMISVGDVGAVLRRRSARPIP